MKRLIMFFLGIVLMVLMFGSLYMTSAIYDAANKFRIDTYFFQPNLLSSMRPGVPESPDDLGDATIRDMLIRKFITEYFYATPDAENIALRMRSGATMSRMADTPVFKEWLNGEARVIQDLAAGKSLRTVRIVNEIYQPQDSKYWHIDYVLTTWLHPNELLVRPVITSGTMQLLVVYERGTRESVDIQKYLMRGGDPAAIFKFKVVKVIRQ